MANISKYNMERKNYTVGGLLLERTASIHGRSNKAKLKVDTSRRLSDKDKNLAKAQRSQRGMAILKRWDEYYNYWSYVKMD